jgi:hypothetical protein
MDDPFMETRLADPWWRLNNLYKIKDKQGNVITFKLNWAQKELYENMHYLNDILKARQLGMTTLIQIFMLDRCLFNDNQNAGVVAHNKEDAEAFFADKIKFAYDNLPDDLKALRKATSDTTQPCAYRHAQVAGVETGSAHLRRQHAGRAGRHWRSRRAVEKRDQSRRRAAASDRTR